MPRIRSIKPEFFLNEELPELPAMTRLLFIGLWTQSDREGRLQDRPKRLKASLFAYDDYDVDKGLDELQAAGFILRYKVNDLNFLQIINFEKHQNPNPKEIESVIPPCFLCVEEPIQISPSSVEEPIQISPSTLRASQGREGVGNGLREREGVGNGTVSKKTYPQQPPPSIHDVISFFLEKGFDKEIATRAFNYYEEAEWHDKNGKPVKNWKQKMISVWMTDEQKSKSNEKYARTPQRPISGYGKL